MISGIVHYEVRSRWVSPKSDAERPKRLHEAKPGFLIVSERMTMNNLPVMAYQPNLFGFGKTYGRAKTIQLESSHASMISQSEAVAALILEAAGMGSRG